MIDHARLHRQRLDDSYESHGSLAEKATFAMIQVYLSVSQNPETVHCIPVDFQSELQCWH